MATAGIISTPRVYSATAHASTATSRCQRLPTPVGAGQTLNLTLQFILHIGSSLLHRANMVQWPDIPYDAAHDGFIGHAAYRRIAAVH